MLKAPQLGDALLQARGRAARPLCSCAASSVRVPPPCARSSRKRCALPAAARCVQARRRDLPAEFWDARRRARNRQRTLRQKEIKKAKVQEQQRWVRCCIWYQIRNNLGGEQGAWDGGLKGSRELGGGDAGGGRPDFCVSGMLVTACWCWPRAWHACSQQRSPGLVPQTHTGALPAPGLPGMCAEQRKQPGGHSGQSKSGSRQCRCDALVQRHS